MKTACGCLGRGGAELPHLGGESRGVVFGREGVLSGVVIMIPDELNLCLQKACVAELPHGPRGPRGPHGCVSQ